MLYSLPCHTTHNHLILFTMKYKTVFIEVLAGDSKGLIQAQTKINQWTTLGLLKKFETHSTGTHWLFQVLLIKQEGE